MFNSETPQESWLGINNSTTWNPGLAYDWTTKKAFWQILSDKIKQILLGGFNPFEKILVRMGILPK